MMKKIKVFYKEWLLKIYYLLQKRIDRGTYIPYLEDAAQVLRADGKHHNWQFGYTNFYSQCGQDFFVDFLLNGKKDGIYLDIGGNDPIVINNTYYFEKKGWNGLAFEPLKNILKDGRSVVRLHASQLPWGIKNA